MSPLLKRYLGALGAIFLLGAAADGVALCYPILLQRLIDGLGATLRWYSASSLLLAVGAFALGGALVTAARDWLATRLAARIDRELSADVLSKMLRLPLGALREHASGQWLVTLQQVQEVKTALGILGVQAIFDLLLVVGYALVLWHYDGGAALAYSLLALVTMLGMSALGSSLYRAVDDGYRLKAQAETFLMEAMRSPLLVRAFNLQSWITKRWAGSYRPSVERFRTADNLAGFSSAFFQLVHQAAPLLVLAWKLPEVNKNQLSFGAAIALSSVFTLGFDPFLKIASVLSQMQKALLSFRAVSETLALPEESGLDAVATAPASGARAVRLEKLVFRYRELSAPALNGIDFVANGGEKVALVGESGSGKSTLLQLLLGLYRPQSGGIFLDDTPLEKIPTAELRRWVGLVSQDSELFSGTVLENIALSAERPDLERARECARLANADRFIDELPEKYLTQVGEGGCALSVGQKQRLALARAIYWDPKVLLLDEPTSALDAITESEIASSLPRIGAGRTLIVAAHRLGTILNFDRIYVMDHGRVIESGNHEELLRRRGSYARLWSVRPAKEGKSDELHH